MSELVTETNDRTQLDSLKFWYDMIGKVSWSARDFLTSRLPNNQSVVIWLFDLYHDPLFTSTSHGYGLAGNQLRDQFIRKVEEILQVGKTPVKKEQGLEKVLEEINQVLQAKVEAPVSPQPTDAELFSSPEWTKILSYLQRMSYWSDPDDELNHTIVHASVHFYQSNTGLRPGDLINEARLRKKKQKETNELDRLTEDIDRFEEVARHINPQEFLQILQRYINTEQNAATGNQEELTQMIHDSQMNREGTPEYARLLDSWYTVTGVFEGLRRERKKISDRRLVKQFNRLNNHPLIGGIANSLLKSYAFA